MAGDEEDSHKTIHQNEGFKVDAYIHGLGENKANRDLYVARANDAWNALEAKDGQARLILDTVDMRALALCGSPFPCLGGFCLWQNLKNILVGWNFRFYREYIPYQTGP